LRGRKEAAEGKLRVSALIRLDNCHLATSTMSPAFKYIGGYSS
jgi:hypothetical protein